LAKDHAVRAAQNRRVALFRDSHISFMRHIHVRHPDGRPSAVQTVDPANHPSEKRQLSRDSGNNKKINQPGTLALLEYRSMPDIACQCRSLPLDCEEAIFISLRSIAYFPACGNGIKNTMLRNFFKILEKIAD
jgi:hypothetical protein